MKKKYVLLVFVLLILLLGFSYRSRIKKEYENLNLIVRAHSVFQLRFANAGSQKVNFYSDSLRIIGDFFNSSSKAPSPCILILHGTHVLGRKQPIILSVAKEFQKLGYSVLSIDFRGYNESQDPLYIKSIHDLDFAQDVISAIDFLHTMSSIDKNKIYILGHSFGAGVALSTIGREERVERYILFGAPRRVRERILNPSSPDRKMLLNKNIGNMKLGYEVDSTIALKSIETRDIEKYVNTISSPTHRNRYLLIDGETEDPKDLKFYKDIANQIGKNSEYFTIKCSDHYLNTGFFMQREAYDIEIVTDFVSKIHQWLLRKNSMD